MEKRQKNSARASALQITLSVALLCIAAILFASSFRAAPPAAPGESQSDAVAATGPVSQNAAPRELPNIPAAPRQDGFFPPLPLAPQGSPLITVSLPTGSLDNSVPSSTVIIEPVMTTLIDPTTTAGLNYVGFQGDFLFDSAVLTFLTTSPGPTGGAGLTAVNWNVSGNLLNSGPGTTRTLRVSAFSNNFTPLNGSGTLFNVRMLRVSNIEGATSTLAWQPAPDNFIFIDDNLNTHTPNQTNGLITIARPPVCALTEGFDDITTLVPGGWFLRNNSQPGPGPTNWFQGSTAFFPSQSGPANSYIAANYDNGTGTSTLSNWLLTKRVTLQNNAQLTFWA